MMEFNQKAVRQRTTCDHLVDNVKFKALYIHLEQIDTFVTEAMHDRSQCEGLALYFRGIYMLRVGNLAETIRVPFLRRKKCRHSIAGIQPDWEKLKLLG